MNNSEAARGHDVLYTYIYIYQECQENQNGFFLPFFFSLPIHNRTTVHCGTISVVVVVVVVFWLVEELF